MSVCLFVRMLPLTGRTSDIYRGTVARLGRKGNILSGDFIFKYFILLDIAKVVVILSVQPWNCASTYRISFWYQHVRHHLGSVLKKVSERFDHIRDRGGRKRVEKHGFLGVFRLFSVRFVSKGFQYDFCGMYWLWVGSSYCGEYF